MDVTRLRVAIVGLLVLLLSACGSGGGSGGGGGGGGPTPVYPTTSLYITVSGSGAQAAGLSFTPQTFIGTFGDVTSVTVVVSGLNKFGVFQNPLAIANLTLIAGVWSGTVPDLPVGPTLTFTAHGYNASSVEIFSGVTSQALTGTGDSVSVAMAPVDNGTPIAFPIITGITRPAEVVHDATAAVQVAVTGSPNETLTYALTSGGGSFAPAGGTLALPGSGIGTIGSTYTAPAALGSYTHSVRVTNSQGNAVEADFAITVVSAVTSPGTEVSFAPVISSLLGKRTGNTVTWTATVSDDGPLAALSYAWSFSQTGGTAGSSFTTANANPGIQAGYDQTVTGTITLTVTDGGGLSTTITFTLVPGQFPDSLVGSGGGAVTFPYTDGDGVPEVTGTISLSPTPFGPATTVTVYVPVDSDVGYVYTCLIAQLTDDFMAGFDRGCAGQMLVPPAINGLVPVVTDNVLPAGNGYWVVVFTSASQAAFEAGNGTMYRSVGGSSTYFKEQWTAFTPGSSADTGVPIPTFSSTGGSTPLAYTNGDGMAELAGQPTLSASMVTIGVDTSITVYVPVDSDAGNVCVTVGQAWNTGNGDPPWQQQGTGCASFTAGTEHTQAVTVVFSGLTAGTLSMTISIGPVSTPDNSNSSWEFASTKNPGLFRVVKYPGSPVGVESETGVPIPTFTAVP